MKRLAASQMFSAAALCANAVFAPASAQRNFDAVEIKTTELADGIYMLEGAGGNMGLSVGADGAFLIDDQFAPLAARIKAAIAQVSDQPVEFLVNTHHHGDHTGGNEPFGESGSYIVSHDNVRKRLAASNRGPDALPVLTFEQSVTFHWNGDEIFVWHPVTGAHTDGDAAIFFINANVVHTGDAFVNGGFPF
ncbi:MAG: MBL fold metallo-hydrolase, partial [Pseudomonadota bacterium]